MPEKRVSKQVTDKQDLEYFLNISEDELLKTTTIMEIFGEFGGKRKYDPYDTIVIPEGFYGPDGNKNQNKFTTTLGHWFFNKCFIEKDLFNVFHYIEEPITKKKFSEINSKITYAVLEKDIELSVLKRFIMKTQKYQPYVHILTPNHTLNMLLITEKINKRKAELLKKYSKEIEAKDEKTVDIIQSDLLNYARELLKDDPSMDMYNSGAKGSFDNNFKNLFIMRGAAKDPDPTKGYNIITSSYMDGVTKEEYSALANTLSAGPYARAKKTEIGGYWEKLFLSAFQHIILDKEGSDCGTKRYIDITITNKNIDDIMYCYVLDGSKLTSITSKNMDKFIGRTVKMRFSGLCESDKICNKCVGDLFYKLNIMNIGVATPQLPSKLKTVSMKNFHDNSIRYIEMEPMKAFGIY